MRPLGFPREWKKYNFYFYWFLPWLFDHKWKYNFRGMQNKTPLEILLHAGHVISLTTLPTLIACNLPYMQYYFKRLFALHFSEVIFSFLIKKSRQKAIEIETAFFIPLGISKVTHWIISFMLHISVITSPTNWYQNQWVSWNISKVINENSTSANLIIWTTLGLHLEKCE